MKQLAKPSRTLPSTCKGLSEASPAGRPAAASLWPVQGLPPLSAAGRPVAASLWPVRSLPPLFLWASEGDVRHFGPPSNAPRQLAGLLRPLCGLSEACLLSSYGLPKATLGILDLWPVRSLPPLFLWASEGDVRHFGPPSNAPRQLAGLLRPLCGLSEACLLSSYGLPKATLGILDRLQTPARGFKPFPAPLAYSCIAGLPLLFLSFAPRQLAGLLRPLCGLSEACLLSSYGLPKATLGILDRLQTLLGSWQACCGLSVACPKPASSLLMGFRRRR